jgi:hypothetical protein
MEVKREFLAKLDKKITQISLQSKSCPKSQELGGVYRCNVSKQTIFLYRIDLKMQEIEIITFYNVGQNPDKYRKTSKILILILGMQS